MSDAVNTNVSKPLSIVNSSLFVTDLPECMYQMDANTVDTNDAKLAACLMNEYCEGESWFEREVVLANSNIFARFARRI